MSRKRSRKPDRNQDSRPSYNKKKQPQPQVRRGSLEPLVPRTKGQEEFLDAIRTNDITICDGPSGSGKTLLAFGAALHYRESDYKIKRIVIVRPTLPAGDDDQLGYLPGSLEDKMSPFLLPLIKDSAPLLISTDKSLSPKEQSEFIDNYLGSLDIEVIPFQFMRGRSLNGSFIILDEAQNCTKSDLKLFLTRIGKDSKVVIEGDSNQSDREDSGFGYIQDKLSDMEEVKIVQLGAQDIVRNPLIAKILRRLDD